VLVIAFLRSSVLRVFGACRPGRSRRVPCARAKACGGSRESAIAWAEALPQARRRVAASQGCFCNANVNNFSAVDGSD